MFLTRDLVSEPPNVLNPAEMAERCKSADASSASRSRCSGPKEMRKLGFGALLGVAQGSVERAAHGGDAAGTAAGDGASRGRSRWRSSARA